MFEFELNEIVKDKITGFNGVIMARTEYSTGCIQYGVAAQKVNDKGGIDDWVWFDESRLLKTNKSLSSIKRIGGPHQTAPQN